MDKYIDILFQIKNYINMNTEANLDELDADALYEITFVQETIDELIEFLESMKIWGSITKAIVSKV